MINSLFVMSPTGEVMIEKHYRGYVPRTCCDTFWAEVQKSSSPQEVCPVLVTPKYYLIHVQRYGMFFIANVQMEVQPLLVTEFLHRVVDVFRDYFNEVSEESIKENFITVYQLMDEMMDNGIPMTTEPNVLKTMIVPPTILGRVASSMGVGDKSNVASDLPEGMLSSIWWRKKGVKYTNNEVYLDIVEEIDCSIDTNGLMVTCDVSGEVLVNCKLSGMPDLTLSFTNPALIDEANFHPCVRLSRYERDRVMSFVPPDGKFKLASYSVCTTGQAVVLPLYVKPQIHFSGSSGRVNVMVGPKSNLAGRTIEDVVITIPFSKGIASTNLSVNHGTAHFDDATKTLRWDIGKVPKDKSPCLNGTVALAPGAETPESGPTMTVDFKIVMFSASGLKIDALTLSGEKYKPYKGVRFVTKAGKFQVRS
uniref:MHD domain-containing protein n=1 Tax=Hemiselmis tepida TaxID=464990 RepID=A0A7S0W2X6_9CRYP|mmetsp:Transcript_38125/g.97452  ORF Transcript_38125/g.97452 Transcript_38125/m.97452 type:complete len:421 (+) Transcript_38125:64-1326(+)